MTEEKSLRQSHRQPLKVRPAIGLVGAVGASVFGGEVAGDTHIFDGNWKRLLRSATRELEASQTEGVSEIIVAVPSVETYWPRNGTRYPQRLRRGAKACQCPTGGNTLKESPAYNVHLLSTEHKA